MFPIHQMEGVFRPPVKIGGGGGGFMLQEKTQCIFISIIL